MVTLLKNLWPRTLGSVVIQLYAGECTSSLDQHNTAFTLSGFDDQERNLTIVKTAFQVLKLKVFACSLK